MDDGAGGEHLAALDTPHQGVLGRQAGRWTEMSITEEEGHSFNYPGIAYLDSFGLDQTFCQIFGSFGHINLNLVSQGGIF